MIYFEPAVLTAPDRASADRDLALWAHYSDSDGGLLEKAVEYPQGAKVQIHCGRGLKGTKAPILACAALSFLANVGGNSMQKV